MLNFVPTPTIRLTHLFPTLGVFAKCEFLAPSGSFKIRATEHLLTHLLREAGPRELVVPSMGNTALAVAEGARAYGFRMTGVVPQSITRAKDEKLQALGVELIRVPGGGTDVLRRAAELAEQRRAYLVHPHLDPHWTDGYLLLADEILQAVPDCRTLVFPVGGGGLLMGLTEYFLRWPSAVRLIGCEAYNAPTYAVFNHPRSGTIADGLILEEPHMVVKQRVDEVNLPIRLVKDDAIREAMRGLYFKQGWVVEPSSAVTVACVEADRQEFEEPICVILTGENIARGDFFRLIG
jgi:threonine dehydratase